MSFSVINNIYIGTLMSLCVQLLRWGRYCLLPCETAIFVMGTSIKIDPVWALGNGR